MANKRKLTPAAYAKARGLNKSTISRQVASGHISTDENGLLDPTVADQEREKNLSPRRREQAARRKQGVRAKPAVGAKVPTIDAHQVRVAAVLALTGRERILSFAKACLAAGCSREQCAAISAWFACAASDLEDISPEDVAHNTEPSPEQLAEILGEFDVTQADEIFDKFSIAD